MKAYKFKIKRPSKAIVAKFDNTLSLCRELYNSGLRERIDAYKLNQISISYQDQQNQLPEIKEEDVSEANIIVSMAEEETLPEYMKDNSKVRHWKIEDPKNQTIEEVRATREQINHLVNKLLEEIGK